MIFRFRYMGLKMTDISSKHNVVRHWEAQGGNLVVREGLQYAESRVDDAFSTVIQWLHWRIPFTRGKPRPEEKLYLPILRPSGMEGQFLAHFDYPANATTSTG